MAAVKIFKNKQHVGSNPTHKGAKLKRGREQDDEDRATAQDYSRLFPLDEPGVPRYDEDDIQEFYQPPGSPPSVPDEILNEEKHLPEGAVLAESQFPDKNETRSASETQRTKGGGEAMDPRLGPPDLGGSGIRPRNTTLPTGSKRGKVNINYGMSETAWDEKLQALEYYQPRPFETLMEEITQWYIQGGTDYQIFPFHVLRCCDYLWLAMGKRRTGKTTLYVCFLLLFFPVEKHTLRLFVGGLGS